jgi:hypothetical protein
MEVKRITMAKGRDLQMNMRYISHDGVLVFQIQAEFQLCQKGKHVQ